MKVKFEDNELVAEVQDVLKRMPKALEKEKKTFLKKVGDVIKGIAERNIKRSNIINGSYKHMADDVKSTIRTDKSGELFVSVGGGKETGYKWRFLNDGTMDEKGRQHTKATHFMEKTISESESEIEKLVDELLTKVVE
jgi:HK97 gp10 family phage protein